jgi:hypothetical protein
MTTKQSPKEVTDPFITRCDMCGRSIDERKEIVWQMVTGWEKRRRQGGTNHLALRKPQDQSRCWVCMDRMLSGDDPHQVALFGE